MSGKPGAGGRGAARGSRAGAGGRGAARGSRAAARPRTRGGSRAAAALGAQLAAARRIVLALDYDGTLVPIRPRPEMARPSRRLLEVLQALARRRDVKIAFVSGRSLAELRSLLPVRGAAFLGNHGLEMRDGRYGWTHPAAKARRPLLRRLARALGPAVARVPGAWIEDKGLTLSIHHRAVRRPADAARLGREIRRAVGGVEAPGGGDSATPSAGPRRPRRAPPRPGLRVTRGKKVREIRPHVDWDKGRAIAHWRRETGRRGTLVVLGDDRTDEDAFRRLRGRAVTVKVGPGPTAAGWRVSRAQVRRLLLSCRKPETEFFP